MSKFAKAITAAVLAGLAALTTALVDGTSFGDLTDGQWVSIASFTIGAGAAVYGIKNAPPS